MNDIQQAAFELRLDDLRQLMKSGTSLEGTLLAACSSHDAEPKAQVKVIRYLSKSGASVNETDKNGVTPLHRAVRFRNVAAVEELIKQGAEVNAVDKRSHSTPLHRAVTSTGAPATAGKTDRAVEIAELLLKNGADISLKNRNGKAAIDYVKNPMMTSLIEKHRSK